MPSSNSASARPEKINITQMDMSRRQCGAGDIKVGYRTDGKNMRVGGIDIFGGFLDSLCMHAPARIDMPLGEGALSLELDCARDERDAPDGVMAFRILLDGKVVAETGPVRSGEAPRHLAADLRGATTCTFEALDGGDGNEGDYVDLLNIKFWYEPGKFPPGDVRSASRQLGILTPPPGPAPRINGPEVFGVRPCHPVIYRLPVVGERPVALSAKNLPAGLSFDPQTQILSGSVATPGDYEIVFSATNAHGSAERTLTLKVGDKICLTPAMGWNSWNAFGPAITADKVKAAADALVASGLADHGWCYVNIDDCWQNNQDNPRKSKSLDPNVVGPARHEDGTICANKYFPDMKGLADYIHAKGLRFGIYSSPGPYTCGGFTGSYGHVEQDARTYAEWGCDFLKYDQCSYWNVAFGERHWRTMPPYWLMGRALAHQNRDIVFSLCQYGMETPGLWGNIVRGHSWRTTGDIFDVWDSVLCSIECQKPMFPFSRPGAFNDPDMLCVGAMRYNDYHPSRLAPNEQYTHISFWALLAAPMMIGCDLTKLDEFTISLLTNDEVIALDQDPLCASAGWVDEGDGWEVWARPLADGSIAAGLLNLSLHDKVVPLNMETLGLECKWRVRDLWRQVDEGIFLGRYEHLVPAHGTHLIKLIPTECACLRDGLDDIRDNAWRLLMKRDGAAPEMLQI